MQKLKSDIQKTILDAAEYLFIRKGYKNTAMREIAAKADVGLSNIYNYFPNKDSLFRYILQPPFGGVPGLRYPWVIKMTLLSL